LRSTRLVN